MGFCIKMFLMVLVINKIFPIFRVEKLYLKGVIEMKRVVMYCLVVLFVLMTELH